MENEVEASCFLDPAAEEFPGAMANVLRFSPMEMQTSMPEAQLVLQVYSYAFWFGFPNGEWRM